MQQYLRALLSISQRGWLVGGCGEPFSSCRAINRLQISCVFLHGFLQHVEEDRLQTAGGGHGTCHVHTLTSLWYGA